MSYEGDEARDQEDYVYMLNDAVESVAAGGAIDEASTVREITEALDNGVHPDQATTREMGAWTALHAAAALGNLALVQKLIGMGANKTLQNTEGRTPFDLVGDNMELKALLNPVPTTFSGVPLPAGVEAKDSEFSL